MNHASEEQLAALRDTLLRMSNLTFSALQRAVQALNNRDQPLAADVIAGDCAIDQLEMEVDDRVVRYMATRAPIARDSRLMLAASKIASSLERIADQATTIARNVLALAGEPSLPVPAPLPHMAALAAAMLRDAMNAFVDGTEELANTVIARDLEVDQLNHLVIATLIEQMMENRASIRGGVLLISISKALERAADHAQNIAEEVYYLYRGEDIRHR